MYTIFQGWFAISLESMVTYILDVFSTCIVRRLTVYLVEPVRHYDQLVGEIKASCLDFL